MAGDGRDIVIGRVVAPVGVKGEVKLIALTDFPERFEAGRTISLLTENGNRRIVRIQSSREYKQGFVLKLEGVDSRQDAEALRNCEAVIDETELADLEQGSFYVFDLIGLKVITDDGREQGEITEVLQGGANDVYVTSTGLCIPALKTVVAHIDIDKREMIIRPVPGLLRDD